MVTFNILMVEIFGNKNMDELKQADIQLLIDTHQEENIILEFKKEIGSNSKEIAKDISGMANSEGGFILYGINEDANGKAMSFEWSEAAGFGEKLENILATTITPSLNFKIFSIENDQNPAKKIYLLFIPKSNNLHMVIKENDNRYYKRQSKTVLRMEDSEIKLRIRNIKLNEESLRDTLNLLKKDFSELAGINLNSISRINYFIIPEELAEKVKTIDELNSILEPIKNPLSEGLNFRAFRGTIANSQFTDARQWHKSCVIHKNGIIEFRRSHDYAGIFASSKEASILLNITSFTNCIYKALKYYGGYRIFLEIGNTGKYAFMPTFFNQSGVFEKSIGELQENIEIEPLLIQQPSKNSLKILELIKLVGGTVGVNGEGNYQDVKKVLGIPI